MFNVKIITFPNGEVQLRTYSQPIITGKKNQERREVEPDELEPEILEVEPVNSNDNEWRSLARTKQAVFSYARCVKWEYFLTFTMSSRKIDRYDFNKCSSAIRKWFNNIRSRYAPDIKYLVVPEEHKDGAWHFHAVVSDIGNLPITPARNASGRLIHCRQGTIYNCLAWQFGFTQATKVGDYHAVARYIGKYTSKSLHSIAKGRQRYYVSEGLNKPIEETFMCSNEQLFTDYFCKLNGYKIVKTSEIHSEVFTKVQYIELMKVEE